MTGACECGCGQKTKPAPVTYAERGWVKGEPVRFVSGHNMRGRRRPEIARRFTGSGNPRWNGGRTKHARGYVWVKVGHDHPMADSRGYCLEHRLVVAAAIGRPLTAREVVHHRNGIKSDNRHQNLELCDSQRLHMRYHQETCDVHKH